MLFKLTDYVIQKQFPALFLGPTVFHQVIKRKQCFYSQILNQRVDYNFFGQNVFYTIKMLIFLITLENFSK